jgi:thymidine kinase
MVEFIVGEKGRGKTTHLIERAEKAVESADGSVVFIDRDNTKMFDLNRNIRLVNLKNYNLVDHNAFIGFVSGIISQNKDIEYIFIDGFMNDAKIDVNSTFEETVNQLEDISDQFNINFVLSVSKAKEDIPETLYSKIVLAL